MNNELHPTQTAIEGLPSQAEKSGLELVMDKIAKIKEARLQIDNILESGDLVSDDYEIIEGQKEFVEKETTMLKLMITPLKKELDSVRTEVLDGGPIVSTSNPDKKYSPDDVIKRIDAVLTGEAKESDGSPGYNYIPSANNLRSRVKNIFTAIQEIKKL